MIKWSDVFEYDNGILRWKPRDKCQFKSERLYKSWSNRFAGATAGSLDKAKRGLQDYLRVRYEGKAYSVHRVVWEMFNGGIPDGFLVDHIDGDGLNNRIENLRIVNPGDSQRNRPLQINNTSGTPGVTYNKKYKTWQVTLCKNYLGSYKNLEDAINARKEAEINVVHPNHGRVGRLRGRSRTRGGD